MLEAMQQNWLLFLVYFVALSLLPVSDAYFMRTYGKDKKIRRVVDRRSLKIFRLAVAAGLTVGVLAFLFRIAPIGLETRFIACLALPLILGGIVLRSAAIVTLGRSFTANIEVSEDQKIVTQGPYRTIRHPAYAGLLITLLGWGLTFENWIAVISLFGFALAAILFRIRIEEAALKSAFGSSYTDYMKRTKALVPFVV
ncbi:MAG: isoprenylcysteine carboxylmethyltransferase family protein [Pseudomonadota bacterium]